MTHQRRQARTLAMQALCQWDVQKDESPERLEELLAELAGRKRGARYAAELVRAFWSRREEVDGFLSAAAAKWELSRISVVERNIMRVAVTEMLLARVPPKTCLQEAVEVGDRFGGAESPRFINGVLDAVLHRIETQTKSEP